MKEKSNDIEKYRKGELSDAERHALEKKALTDPFLADALEGIEQVAPEEFDKDVHKLHSRINKKKPIFTPLRIAAGVIVIITAAWTGLYLLRQSDVNTLSEQTAGEQDSTSTSGPTAAKDQENDKLLSLKQEAEEKKTESKNKRIATAPASKDLASRDDATTEPPATTAKPEEQPAQVTEDKKAETLAERRDTVSITLTQPPVSSQGLAKAEEEDTRAKAASGQSRRTAELRSTDDGRLSKAAPAAKESASTGAVIAGKVTLAEDNLALPGVNVRLKGSSIGTVTDLNGDYTLAVDDPRPTLVFSFIGLQTQEVPATGDGTLNVKLTEDISQLSEVVVTGAAIPADLSGDPIVRLAEPVGGLRAYDKYLESNLRYPQQALSNNIKGRVGIQFTVGTDGSLNEFRVTKSLGFGCDEEVIRLVKEGPRWIPSSENNVPTESIVRVRMRFDPAKRK